MSLYTMVGGLPLYAVLTMAFALAGWAFALSWMGVCLFHVYLHVMALGGYGS